MSESGKKSGQLLVTVWGNSTEGNWAAPRDNGFSGTITKVQNTKIFPLPMFQKGRTCLIKNFIQLPPRHALVKIERFPIISSYKLMLLIKDSAVFILTGIL